MKTMIYTLRHTASTCWTAITSPAAAVAAIDVGGVAAVASISYGFWLIFAPAGYIAAGALVLAGVVFAARNSG